MKRIKSVLMLVVLLLGACISSAAQTGHSATPRTSPDALVAALYKQSKNKRSPFFQTRSRALVGKYFEKTLADLIWKDASGPKDEVGAIDGDPLFNAQDMDIKRFSIHPASYKNGKAEVTVSFENFGQKQEVLFLLVVEGAAWKIEDIKYTDGTTLTGILKADQAH